MSNIKDTILTTFSELGITQDLIKGLNENKIFTPSEIQKKAIPFLLEHGTDLIAQAQTGTGKTAAFGLPLLQQVDPTNRNVQALILSPTRELGQQIAKQLFKFTKFSTQIYVEAVYGGAPIEKQISSLQRPTQIVVATPGRLVDLLERKAIDLHYVKTVVLDEADEMLSMGFKKDLDYILEQTHGKRNTWLFSATIPEGLKDIIKNYMSPTAHRIQIDKKNQVNKDIEHHYVLCDDADDKLEVLLYFLKTQGENRGIIFCKTKNSTQILAKQLLAKNISADALHGDLLQKERDKVMRAFKNEKLRILVSTDVAARGIDVDNLSYVAHYQLPDELEYYTHRSGRTARAGKKGLSIILATESEVKQLKNIEKTLGIFIKEVPR
ncbi:MAG TPA: DEAD/DEAH box helicase [Cytophagaceae bacterium]|nr:DEAD/DEAH box helicase [Cytophagaceae bacterium]